ncbi:MAG: UDP-N-acetyl glucosamine 2-epimerase [Candidatus Marinimicrobia bacterium]|nr:UDP-N-acetyl glucosamine 2-epimerase [Candidatus Neomarinimicrobiota bacterium]
MIDSLVAQLEKAAAIQLKLVDIEGESIDRNWQDTEQGYAVMTFHRPSNVDDQAALGALVEQWIKTAELLPVIFPIHPRTQNMLEQFGLLDELRSAPNIYLTGPLAYLEFLKLVSESALVITDSGGIQEETTYLKIPCLTVRPTTERPVTIWEGSNQLIKAEEIYTKAVECLGSSKASFRIPKYWEGQSAGRIVGLLESFADSSESND